MPAISDGAPTHADFKGIGPNDISSEWLDNMVKRLFKELNRQLLQIEHTKAADSKDGRARTENARTLNMLERTMERLARLERERAAIRERKVARNDDDARAALERKLDQLLAAARARPDLGEPQK